jgi:hypothetical protein
MPLNHTFRVAYLLFQVVMVAFTVLMVAFSAKGGYDHRYRLSALLQGRRTIQMRLLRCDLHETNRLVRTDSQMSTVHSNQAAMRVMALTVPFIPES